MELSDGLACLEIDFCWPGEGDAACPMLKKVTAAFPTGSISLVAGETGVGKSTLLHLLAGLLRPTAGEVYADGRPVSRWPASHRDPWRQQVGIVFQHLALMPDLTAAENLLLPLLPRSIPWPRMQADIRRQLGESDLLELADTPARRLSGGQRQRLAVARALVGRPRFILADEPSAFQDDGHAEHLLNLLQDAADRGAVLVICSQDPRLRQSPMVDQHLHLASGHLTTVLPQGQAP